MKWYATGRKKDASAAVGSDFFPAVIRKNGGKVRSLVYAGNKKQAGRLLARDAAPVIVL